ncbi:hypothetical protein [Xanthomonas vesicatoria]|uniref:hypothetical protein n=1 Tax=Xanthomonas vesicatoria TaxID=56460 RepID=UPI001E5E20A0|nr:hypothetical protein [Xanthomonas vesicatoria]MCC8625715.1 hypothetical protein [Xanthomonas vesicatoria]
MRHTPVVTARKQRLHARAKQGKQIVCAAMRKLLHLVNGVLISVTVFAPTNPLPDEGQDGIYVGYVRRWICARDWPSRKVRYPRG